MKTTNFGLFFLVKLQLIYVVRVYEYVCTMLFDIT